MKRLPVWLILVNVFLISLVLLTGGQYAPARAQGLPIQNSQVDSQQLNTPEGQSLRAHMVKGTVDADPDLAAAVQDAISQSDAVMKSADSFAITDIQAEGNWRFVSVIGLSDFSDVGTWNLLDHGVWFGLALALNDGGKNWTAAIEGTREYRRLLFRVPNTILSPQAKKDLDPINRIGALANSTYLFPWAPGTSMQYGSLGVHDNEFGAVVPGWKAVDLLSDGNTSAGHAPNSLRAAAAGTISYKCSPLSGQVTTAIRINDLMYAHLNNSSNLGTGQSFSQGEELGTLKTGNFNEKCGYASQSTSTFHVHFGFPNNGTFEAGGWTLSLSDGYWRKGGETRGTGAWLTADGGGGTSCSAPSLIEPSNNAVLSNRNVTFRWNAISGCTFNGYTFRVCTSSNIADLNNCTGTSLKDTGVGGTQYSYDITGRDNQDLWWGVIAANATNGANWSEARKFKISPNTTPPGNWSADFYDTVQRWDDTNNSSNKMCSNSNVGSGFLDINYGQGAGCSGVVGDTWIGDYQRSVSLNGTYVFYLNHDDGARLWVNGDRKYDRAEKKEGYTCPPITLNGNTTLRVMLREDSGDANIKVTWSTDTSPCNKPGTPTLNNISNSDGDGNYTVSWSSASLANEYRLEERPAGGSWSHVQTSGATNRNITGKANGDWCYRVQARTANGVDGDWSAEKCTTVGLPSQPDLIPYTPAGYQYPVVPASVKGIKQADTTLYTRGDTYFNWYFKNNDSGIASGSFYVDIWIDGDRIVHYPYSNYNAGYYGGFDDWATPITSPGTHTVRIVVDPDNTIAESNESNNVWERTFTWLPVNGWWAEFYNNQDLSGDPVLVRDDAAIDFTWHSDAPGPRVNSDHFSVRWTKNVSFGNWGRYQFNLKRDDGIRFYFNGEKIADRWLNGVEYFSVVHEVSSAGVPYPFILEAYENDGEAMAVLSWDLLPPDQPVIQPIDNADGDGNFSVGWWPWSLGSLDHRLEAQKDGGTWGVLLDWQSFSFGIELKDRGAGQWCYRLQSRNSAGSSTKSAVVCTTVTAAPVPTASFDATPLSGTAPLTVRFHDISQGNYTTCLWEYGDGQTRNQCDAGNYHDHVYTTPGVYSPSLTVTGPGGNNKKTIANYITVALATPTIDPIANNDKDGNYTVSWSASVGATSYELQEKLNNGAWVSDVAILPNRDFTQKASGTWCYRVGARGLGGFTDWSNTACTTVEAAQDTEDPTVTWTAPVGNGEAYNVSGETVTLKVTATDNVAIDRVVFQRWDHPTQQYVFLFEDHDAPYETTLDTSVFTNDWNEVFALAYDTSGNFTKEYIWLYYSPPTGETIYISPQKAGAVGGITFTPADILAYDTGSQTWSLYFDASDVNVSQNVVAFTRLDDDRLLLVFQANPKISALGTVTASDVIAFTPTSLGGDTAGSFAWYIDGSDVGLTAGGEKINALAVNPANGDVLISTSGTAKVSGSGSNITSQDEDVLALHLTSPGSNTAGTWSLFFDGTPVKGMKAVDINGLWVDEATDDLYVAITGKLTLNGIKVDGRDIVRLEKQGNSYTPVELYWDGSAKGFPKNIDAIGLTK